jgi:hypothetical protein
VPHDIYKQANTFSGTFYLANKSFLSYTLVNLRSFQLQKQVIMRCFSVLCLVAACYSVFGDSKNEERQSQATWTETLKPSESLSQHQSTSANNDPRTAYLPPRTSGQKPDDPEKTQTQALLALPRSRSRSAAASPRTLDLFGLKRLFGEVDQTQLQFNLPAAYYNNNGQYEAQGHPPRRPGRPSTRPIIDPRGQYQHLPHPARPHPNDNGRQFFNDFWGQMHPDATIREEARRNMAARVNNGFRTVDEFMPGRLVRSRISRIGRFRLHLCHRLSGKNGGANGMVCQFH